MADFSKRKKKDKKNRGQFRDSSESYEEEEFIGFRRGGERGGRGRGNTFIGRNAPSFKQRDNTPPQKKMRGSSNSPRGNFSPRRGNSFAPSPNNNHSPKHFNPKKPKSGDSLHFGFVYNDSSSSSDDESNNESKFKAEENSSKEEEKPILSALENVSDETLFFVDKTGSREEKKIKKILKEKEVPRLFNRLKINSTPNLSEYEAEDENNNDGRFIIGFKNSYDVEESSNNEEESLEVDSEMDTVMKEFNLENYDEEEENFVFAGENMKFSKNSNPKPKKNNQNRNKNKKPSQSSAEKNRKAAEEEYYEEIMKDYEENFEIDSEDEGANIQIPTMFEIHENFAPTRAESGKSFSPKGSSFSKKEIKKETLWVSGGSLSKTEIEISKEGNDILTVSSAQITIDLLKEDDKDFPKNPRKEKNPKKSQPIQKKQQKTKKIPFQLKEDLPNVEEHLKERAEIEEMMMFSDSEDDEEDSLEISGKFEENSDIEDNFDDFNDEVFEEEEEGEFLEEEDDELVIHMKSESAFDRYLKNLDNDNYVPKTFEEREAKFMDEVYRINKSSREMKDAARESKKEFAMKMMMTQSELVQMSRQLEQFVKDDESEVWELESMPPIRRKQVHTLCELYNLSTQSEGPKHSRCITIFKGGNRVKIPTKQTLNSFIPELVSLSFITKFSKPLSRKERTKEAKREAKKEARTSRAGRKKDKRENRIQQKVGNAAKPTPGSQVGETASPLGDENLGKRLLTMMGWSGGGLGSQGQGIVNPVGAVVWNRKNGLGFDQ